MANIVIVEISNSDTKDVTYYSATIEEESVDGTSYEDSVDAYESGEPQERPYPCTHCTRSFSRKADLIRHFRIHSGEKPFCCPECGDDFNRRDDMIRHLRTHTGVKPFPCLLCRKSFGRKSDLNIHRIIHKEKDFYCPKCESVFMPKSKFLKHMQMHTAEENGLPCSECGNLFPCRKGMLRLCKADGGGKRYICVACRKKRSEKSVSSKKVVECPQCGDSFGRKADMIRHLRLHTGIKPFPCPTCLKHFSRKEDMVRHNLTHSAAKLYTCSLCDQGFTKKAVFDSHIASHTGNSKKRRALDVENQNCTCKE